MTARARYLLVTIAAYQASCPPRHVGAEQVLLTVQRFATRARRLRRTTTAPSPAMGAQAMTRQLRWPWCGGFVSLTLAAGFVARIETPCERRVPTTSLPPASARGIHSAARCASRDLTTSNPAALAA